VASTSEAYAHLFRLLCEEGDEVLAPRPSYPLLEPLAALEGVRLETYRLAHGPGWRLDLDSLEGALSPRTRAVVLVQPNNPTGSCLSRDEFARVEDHAARRIAIVSDGVRRLRFRRGAGPFARSSGRRALTFALGGLQTCGICN
jgi:aspartate/methionine/tyrosine aminotransferase